MVWCKNARRVRISSPDRLELYFIPTAPLIYKFKFRWHFCYTSVHFIG